MMTALKQTHVRISRLDRTLITAVVLLSSVFPVELFSNTPPAAKGLDGQYSGKQGQVLVVKVKGEEQATEVKGTFLKRTIPFFREFRPGEPTGYIGLLGIDMQDDPGTYELAVEVKQGEQAKQLSFNVLVAKEKFAVEHLKLPKEKVDLDEKNVARWKAEQQLVQQALAENSRLKLWHSNFVEPVNGKRTGIFGSVRIMNGQPRNPHNGEDIGAPMGADVAATNDGDCAHHRRSYFLRQRRLHRPWPGVLYDVFPSVGSVGQRRRLGHSGANHRQGRGDRPRHRPASPLGSQTQRRPCESLFAARFTLQERCKLPANSVTTPTPETTSIPNERSSQAVEREVGLVGPACSRAPARPH